MKLAFMQLRSTHLDGGAQARGYFIAGVPAQAAGPSGQCTYGHARKPNGWSQQGAVLAVGRRHPLARQHCSSSCWCFLPFLLLIITLRVAVGSREESTMRVKVVQYMHLMS